MQYQGGVSGLYCHVTSLIVGDLSPPGGHQQLLRVPGHHGALRLLHLCVTSVSSHHFKITIVLSFNKPRAKTILAVEL